MSELAAAIPDEGGYVTWVRRAFGPFWSFQVGWWSWVDSFVDIAVYPALFVEYARLWWPGMDAVERWLLALVFIWGLTALNVLGVRLTARAAVVCAGLSLAPVALLTLVALPASRSQPWLPWFASGQSWGSLGFGLAVVMWNYSGWDTPTTVLGETAGPSGRSRLPPGSRSPSSRSPTCCRSVRSSGRAATGRAGGRARCRRSPRPSVVRSSAISSASVP